MTLIRRLFILAWFLIVLTTGCAPAPQSNSNSTVSTQPSPSPSASPSPAITIADTASVQITLPLLDALLTDDKFVARVKKDLKLNDQQIEELKNVSGSAVARLRESNAEDLDGDEPAAPARAEDQLRSVLGEEKARDLAKLANDYWSKGDASEASNDNIQMLKGPNAVPTDTRVVVNIPAFRMDLFQDGSLVKSYKVGIGYPQFPLPLGLRRAQQIIFNPTWTPPDSPWVAKMKNVAPGETVEAGDKDNPLGPIKIPIGLPSLIHGGKSPAKIGKFASHGCVGLTNAQIKDFATMLGQISNTPGVPTKMATYLEDETKTQTVKLTQTVPVELRYETIVIEDGKLHIYRDVYAQDTNTEENLRRVLEANGMKLEDLSEQQRTQILAALNSKPKKEVVIDLGTVAQKGYPAPVDLNTGTTDKTDKQRGSKRIRT
ncbi:MAG TPA: L,D-transpeptidase [Pyrinomonadaceae bacterium]|nr:L,D-transpeptidase [Pyrinomonadaceae bacterium]